jgi:hypothetical protein
MLAGAVRAAIDGVGGFHTVTDDAAATMGTGGRQGMDGTFETVEHMRFAAHLYLKAFIICIAAYLTGCSAIAKHTFVVFHIDLFSMAAGFEQPGLS